MYLLELHFQLVSHYLIFYIGIIFFIFNVKRRNKFNIASSYYTFFHQVFFYYDSLNLQCMLVVDHHHHRERKGKREKNVIRTLFERERSNEKLNFFISAYHFHFYRFFEISNLKNDIVSSTGKSPTIFCRC
jgi:hypothetical protein